MKNIWLKNKLLIIIALYALIFGVAVYFVVFFLIDKIKYTSEQAQKNLIDQQIEEARLGNLPQMEKDWQDYETQKNSIEVILSSGSEISFIESIDSIAQKSGNIIDLKIGDQVDPKEIAKIKTDAKKNKGQKGLMEEIAYDNYFPMQISLRGNYQSLVDFIHLLENSHFYVNIVSIDSKKIILEDNSAKNKTNVFSPDKAQEEEKQEIILSAINALVYTQRQ
ncbi:MAG: hypothetical protein A2271_04040 [Candidatus Moranbacteria bacterium RIFOXYA12_FULL_35_19]|nr:MAG: hypothetical protein UR78_C0013G0010 [Candidatus Moranbacteria bacterium GW2011_GWF2_35_39]OGI30322.1 MAG: hypothetical protein A2343_00220 [Candidatus Moranbacteria bacterium RIFOXYB12_FULL_35_8]OGI32220.1 MAG: hypothetical protein A2489_00470 [Candidatus Moranbacteria bacterium RIFOXYC12_FULL_36_13]OGI35023.1 MAG: hypothetical protein A2271_04040 [Candidatus Moranbacteria bacterium RIFOXYA12_FULL_35_19]